MNKNNIIGFLLIAVVLIGFSWYNQPSAEEQRTAFVQDSIAKAKHAEMEKASKAAAAKRQTNAKAKVEADSTALFYSALKGQAKKIVLKNKKVELTLNTKGATVEKAVIKGYVGHNLQVKDGSADAKDVTLFEGNDQSLKFMLEAKEANIITSDLYFTPSNVTDKSVTMTAVAGEGKTLTLTYTLGNDYMLHMSLQANGMAGLFSPNYNKMDVDWSDKARQQERGFMFENRYTTLTYHNAEGGTDHLNEGSEKIDEKIEEAIDWVSFKNQFFSAIIVSKDNFEKDAFMTSIPQELKEKFSEDELYYFLDLIDEYYSESGILDVQPDADGYVDIDLEQVVEFIVKEAQKDEVGEYDPEDILFVVQGEMEYGNSLGQVE